ncbi:MAG: 8-amino-7-oxononanoate synthase, partial [Bacteroidota bacterium]|nr:8-amino-7-oxononanoate synthase [Bacteroidota bacterium]
MKTAKNITEILAHRKEMGLFRALRLSDSSAIDFYSNDYLGLAANKELQDAFLDYIRQKNDVNLFGSTGSMLVSGHHAIFEETEDYLAEFYKS